MNPNIAINDTIDDINKKIINEINQLLFEKHISQQKLSKLSGIAQPTISKLLNGDSNFSLNQLIRISNALQENLFNSISTTNFSQVNGAISDNLLELTETDNIILNTERPAFKGYLNTKYYIYFLSTVSNMSNIITGIVSFKSTNTKRCRVELALYTGKKDIQNNDIVKFYTGSMLISIPLSTCYCILKNEEIGELTFFSFHHMFLLNEPMHCRSCSVLTTSSGENRRPTIHRMIMSDYEFDLDNENDRIFLLGQLRMNNKKILIPSNEFEQIMENTPYNKFDLLNSGNINIESQIIEVDENIILGLDMDISHKIDLINRLRSVSLADKNNKISTNTDEFLYSYIQSKNT